MRVLKIVGLVEEYGEGIDRMYREMESRLLAPPVFTATARSVTVTLYHHSVVDVEDQLWLQALETEHLTTDERRVLVEVRRTGAITPRRLRELMPEANAGTLFASAQAKGLLVRIGTRGGARYVLTGAIIRRAGGAQTAAPTRARQLVLDEMRRRGSLSTTDGVKLLGAPPATVRGLLNELVHAGLVRAEGRTRGRRYYPA